jgi:hypothetical protein
MDTHRGKVRASQFIASEFGQSDDTDSVDRSDGDRGGGIGERDSGSSGGGVGGGRGRRPSYAFDAEVLFRNHELAEDAPVPALFEEYPIILKQFILGAKGAGAYPHFHNSAVNALVYGQKRWWLMPPDDAFFTLKHVGDWVENDLPALKAAAAEGKRRLFECTQRSGEVLFVPEQWGGRGDFPSFSILSSVGSVCTLLRPGAAFRASTGVSAV